MRMSGWFFMAISWTVILGVFAWSVWRTLRAGGKGKPG